MKCHPVTGWVRNEPEGTVLLEVQGEPAAVRGALDDLREDMGRNVRFEEASIIDEVPGEARFEITY
jgi:acylphosphatase